MGQGLRRLRGGIGSFLSLERNVLVMSITGLLINFAVQAFQPFIPFYLETLRANIPEIGIVYVGMAIATNLVAIPGGIFADRIGRKLIIVIGNALGFVLYFALLGVNSWTAALLVIFAATVFGTLVQPAYSSAIAESVNVKDRARAFGTFYVLVYLGLALGSMIGGFLPNPGKYELNILVLAIVGLSAAFYRAVFLKETLPREARVNRTKLGRRFFLARLTRNMWLALIALLIFNFSAGLGQPIYAIFSRNELRLSEHEFAVMVGLGYLASMLGAFGAGRVSKNLGVRMMMALAILVEGTLIVPWIYSPNPAFAMVIYAVSGFFSQFFFVGNQTLMANITMTEERSSVIGFITTIAGLGSVVAPYIGSQLWIAYNPRFPFLVSVLLAVAVVGPLSLIRESQFEKTT